VQPWLLLLGVLALTVHLLGVDDALAFNRQLIEQGEIWRLVTCHLSHLNTTHLLENLAGLLLISVLCGTQYSTLAWLGITLFSATLIGSALFLINTSVEWYLGLSGLLHGFLVVGSTMQLYRKESSAIAWGVLLATALKVMYEQKFGPVPGSEQVMGGTVIVDSHLYGAIAGFVSALWLIGVRATRENR